MNTVKNFTTIHLQLNQIDVLEVVIWTIYFWIIFLIRYVLNKTEDLNLSLFNMITGTNESKTLTKDISCICKCRLDGRKCNSMVINRDQWSMME